MSLEKHIAIRHGGITQETSRGRLSLWTLDHGFLVFQVVAHGDRAFVSPIIAGLRRSLRHGAAVQIFVDVERMTSYDTELRTEVTAAMAPERKHIGCLHILVRSKIVAMGVSVANLTLGGIMTIHGEPGPFQHALQTGLAKGRVSGFSIEQLAHDRARKPG